MTHCQWCDSEHDERYLCDPVKAYLAAIHTKAGSYDLPDIEFSEPVTIPAELGDVLMRQTVINGGTAQVGGVHRPVIVITGRDSVGAPLRWTVIGNPQDITRLRGTFDRMCSLAIDAARKANGRAGRSGDRRG